jgi:prepilin-type N-terminal cleavage/methylation domain-containing protein
VTSPRDDDRSRRSAPVRGRRGLSLVEVLLVLLIAAIVVAAALVSADPQIDGSLTQVANAVSSDLAYARSLAVSRGSRYTVTFDLTNHTYTLTHTGANSALNTLPPSPTGVPSASATEQITYVRKMPGSMPSTSFARVLTRAGGTATDTTTIEFNPLGNTTPTNPSEVWIAAGTGSNRVYIGLTIDATTGLVDVGTPTSTAP